MSSLLAAVWGGLLVGCGWAIHAVLLHRELGTWRTDPVTTLPVRRAFYRRAHRALTRPDQMVLLIDLDAFKPINDRLGHHTGDHVLTAVGTRLRTALGPGAVLGRLGGDEFAAVVAVGPIDTPWAARLEQTLHQLRAPIPVPGIAPVRVGVSLGALHLDGLHRPALPAVLQVAEELMYRAKSQGGGIAATVADPADARLTRPVSRRPARRRRDNPPPHHRPATPDSPSAPTSVGRHLTPADFARPLFRFEEVVACPAKPRNGSTTTC